MNQAEGSVDEKNPNFVCKLEKVLYGLRQALKSLAWETEDYSIEMEF